MVVKVALSLTLILIFLGPVEIVVGIHKFNGSTFAGIWLPNHLSFKCHFVFESIGCRASRKLQPTTQAVLNEEDDEHGDVNFYVESH